MRLGRYELLRHLASGGMARVYLARSTGPGGFARHVVVKTIPAERRDDDKFVAMFLDEARLVATLHHQHIAQVFEVGCADDGTYFLVMEYVHGETVRLLLQEAQNRRVKLPLELGLSIACAAAAGLHHAHERRDLDGTPLGIVHRDVSPSNLMVGFDGSIKLIDFGIAKATLRTTHTVTGYIKGKAGYMAPEQARGYPVDRRSDVFALGVLAYELTTQSRAFYADSQYEMMRRAMHGEVEVPSRRVAGYPPALEDVIMTALEVDPEDRFQDAEAMRVAFEQIARELGLVLGDAPVIRALERLFPPRPEPWLIPGTSASEDETAPLPTGSDPMIIVVPRTPTKVRLARGTAAEQESEREIDEAAPDSDKDAPASISGLDTFDLTTQRFERGVAGAAQLALRPATPSELHTSPVQVPAPRHSTSIMPPVERPPATPRASGTSPPVAVAELPLRPLRDTPTPIESPALVLPPKPTSNVAAPRVSTELLVRYPRYKQIAIVAATVAALGFVGFTVALSRDTLSRTSRVASAPMVEPPDPPAPSPPPPAKKHAPARTEARVSGTMVSETRLSETGTVMLHVTSHPEGATVVLDGVRLGVTPFSAPVPAKPGLAWLKVRMRKHIAVKTRVSLEHDVRWDVELREQARYRRAR